MRGRKVSRASISRLSASRTSRRMHRCSGWAARRPHSSITSLRDSFRASFRATSTSRLRRAVRTYTTFAPMRGYRRGMFSRARDTFRAYRNVPCRTSRCERSARYKRRGRLICAGVCRERVPRRGEILNRRSLRRSTFIPLSLCLVALDALIYLIF